MEKIVLPAGHAFTGIVEKLHRAGENIENLGDEITAFFDASEYPVLSHDNKELLAKALDYHTKRVIPPRFSVLAGEIIHHLRSCLDHIVWHFSAPAYREDEKTRRYVEFPILKDPPSPAHIFTQYERKIKGITKPAVRTLIRDCQPYMRPKPLDSILLAIHDIDITDKHREVVLCISSAAIKLPMEVWGKYMQYQLGVPGVPCPDLGADFKRHGQLIPQVAFSGFRGAKHEVVVQALIDMHTYVIHVVQAFDRFL